MYESKVVVLEKDAKNEVAWDGRRTHLKQASMKKLEDHPESNFLS